MKFFTAILLVAFVAVAYAAEESKESASAPKLEPVNEADSQSDVARGKRGFVVGAYTAPVAAVAAPVAAPVVAPVAAAAYTAPVAAAYTYSASVPYPYASYYSYPAVYV